MGENIYGITSWMGKEINIMFDSMDEEFSCLCTFPYNDKIYGNLGIERIKALALFGAAVHLAITDQLEYDDVDEVLFCPEMLPRWIVDAVRRIRFEEINDNKT